MARVTWTDSALSDLEAIADYIALDDPKAAGRLAKKVFMRVGQLRHFPETGSFIPELRPMKMHRQVIIRPCRVFYRYDSSSQMVLIVGVMRSERLFRIEFLERD
jgi:toxin ParE1/3/4